MSRWRQLDRSIRGRAARISIGVPVSSDQSATFQLAAVCGRLGVARAQGGGRRRGVRPRART